MPVTRGLDPEKDALRDKLLGAGSRHDQEALTRLRAEYAALKIQRFVERTVAAAPPLTCEQRQRLAALLMTDSPTDSP